MTSTNAAVRRAAAPDATALGRCIGAAFARDPVSRWTFGSPAAIEAAYQLMAERLYVPAGHSTVIEGGGALWLGPGQPKPLTLLDRFAMGRALTTLAGPRHPWRAIRVDRAMRARRPRTPHAYLFAIGVLPEARGRGVGRALLDHTLRLADRQGLPCYLENTNPVNTRSTRASGFGPRRRSSPRRGVRRWCRCGGRPAAPEPVRPRGSRRARQTCGRPATIEAVGRGPETWSAPQSGTPTGSGPPPGRSAGRTSTRGAPTTVRAYSWRTSPHGPVSMSDAPSADRPRSSRARSTEAREGRSTRQKGLGQRARGPGSATAAGDGSARAGALGNRALGRLLGTSGASTGRAPSRQDAIRHLARAGTGGTPGRLPHFGRIQASFGRHDASRIRAHTGGEAQKASRTMGVAAYATGRDVVFGGTPSLFMAAHEAAHVMQQRAGVHFWGGGGARDRAEREADAVARRVVEGRSAEALIDGMSRRAGPGRPSAAKGTAPVQFWGEPDHYILNQAAGQLAIEHLSKLPHIEDKDYLAKSSDDYIGKGRTKTHDGSRVVDSDTPYETFKLRTDKGGLLTYGGAGRFAGDLAPTTLGAPTRGKSMMGWASKAREKGDDYIGLGLMDITEYGLMATNANHFFPLAGIEYRRQHQTARQKMWMACAMRDKAYTTDAKKAALSLAREALMFEGFASHFLADSFAAGHLSPHALGRIDSPDKKAVTGARVNTWHDILNGLPDGVPTTLGRFHGDYTMDGHDLKYISDVIAQSLLEVAMPWYTGKGYSGNVKLPKPDVARIMDDPVVGPIWAQMCADYEPDFKRLLKVKRRGGKHSLSKYAIYKTTADSQVSHDEVMPELASSVYADGKVPEIDYETETDAEKIGLKVLQIASALRHLLGFRGGWQIHAGVTQGFEPTRLEERTAYKYRIDLQSDNTLKYATDATPPLIPLLASLSSWLEAWASAAPPLTEAKAFKEIRSSLGLLAATLYDNFKETSDKEKPALRRKTLVDLDRVIDKFGTQGMTVPEVDRGFVEQGPRASVSTSTEFIRSSSGLPVRMVAREALGLIKGAPPEEVRAVAEMLHAASRALSMICADPRPIDDGEHTRLYDTVIDVLVSADLFFTRRARIDGPLRARQLIAVSYFEDLVPKIAALGKKGDLSLTKTTVRESTRESRRREILEQLKLDVAPMFELDAAQLYESTGRRMSGD